MGVICLLYTFVKGQQPLICSHMQMPLPPRPPIQTLKIHTDIVINSFMGYLLAGAFFSGQWWDHHSPWAHPPRRFIPFSTSTLRCLLLLYLYCNADLKTGWGMGMGGLGDGKRFSEWLWLVLSVTREPCFASADVWHWLWGLGWRGHPSCKHDSDISAFL